MRQRRRTRRVRGRAIAVAILIIAAIGLGIAFAARPDFFSLPTFGGTTETPLAAAPSTPNPLPLASPNPTATPQPDADENNGEEYPPYDYITYFIFEYFTYIDNGLLPWNLTLVNRYNFLGIYFHPTLTPIGHGHYFDYRAADSLLAMMTSARAEGLSPIIASSFRSVYRQRYLFDRQVRRNTDAGMDADEAFEQARRVVAYPGSSEHNLGLAVDIVAYHYRNLTAQFGQTPEGLWLAQNAHRYGFILRYTYEKQHITNIIYEPWHFRYVGVEHAAIIKEYGLSLEEYLFGMLRQQPRGAQEEEHDVEDEAQDS